MNVWKDFYPEASIYVAHFFKNPTDPKYDHFKEIKLEGIVDSIRFNYPLPDPDRGSYYVFNIYPCDNMYDLVKATCQVLYTVKEWITAPHGIEDYVIELVQVNIRAKLATIYFGS